MLAEKQLKELAIIDTLAYKENISVTKDDIFGYINLMKRPRTREFIYFTLPTTKTYGQELPLSHETIRQQCLREKTLNYVIQRLIKQK
jgi:FKBP-type peptidyl-prolyl cis-trans isomerase (trigger factor)